jgi:hypothetical protein
LVEEINLTKAVVVIQLHDNSVYMVGGAGGTKHLPLKDIQGVHHADCELVVVDKAGIKDLSNKLTPLIRALLGGKKLFLSPLARYWLDPCCAAENHVKNYKTPNYLRHLVTAPSAMSDYIRDACLQLRVLCPNKMLGIGLWRGNAAG